MFRYKGFYEFARLKKIELGAVVGLDVLVDGTVPTGFRPLLISIVVFVYFLER